MGELFDSFDDAEEFLSDHIGLFGDYMTDRGEYEICPVETRK